MNNMLPYTYNGKSRSQAAMQMLLSVAFAREPFPRSEGRGSIEASRAQHDSLACQYQFPRSEGRGSIEAHTGPCSRRHRGFHVRKDVAPLKPMDDGARHLAAPRSFPRSEGRGSIEAYDAGNAPRPSRAFPRSEGRGSIEAACSLRPRSASERRFHVRKDVAPLKRRHAAAVPWPPWRFHVRKDVAPLKRDASHVVSTVPWAGFHVRKDVAPLKPRGTC